MSAPVACQHALRPAAAAPCELIEADAALRELLLTACGVLPKLSDDDPELARQCEAMRQALALRQGQPDSGDLTRLAALLTRAAREQGRLRQQREQSLQAIRVMIAQLAGWLPSLMGVEDRPGTHMGAYVDEILEARDPAALAVHVGQVIEATQAMYAQFVMDDGEVASERDRARRFESELEQLGRQLSATSAQVATDHLTGLLNRRGLERSFADQIAQLAGASRALSLAMIDVDDFKRLNDELGHQAGDDALRHLARLLKINVRPDDVVGRYGGEEFVVLLPGVGIDDAASVIMRIQQQLRSQLFRCRNAERVIRFSAGVTGVGADEGFAAAIARADEAMYRAKRAGKDHVVTA